MCLLASSRGYDAPYDLFLARVVESFCLPSPCSSSKASASASVDAAWPSGLAKVSRTKKEDSF